MTRRLESARVAPGSFISTGPAAYAAIETAISELFGVSLDVLIENGVFAINSDGRITASPRIEADGDNKGLRILSEDDGEEYILSITNSGDPRYLEIYRRTDGSTEAAPIYELVNKMALSGDDAGKWENQVVSFLELTDTPAAFPSARSQLVVNSAHDALEFFDPVAYSFFQHGGSTIISTDAVGVLRQLVPGTLYTGFSLGGTYNEEITIPAGVWKFHGNIVFDTGSYAEGLYEASAEAVSGTATINASGGGFGFPDAQGGLVSVDGIIDTTAGCAIRFLFFRSGTTRCDVASLALSFFRIGLR